VRSEVVGVVGGDGVCVTLLLATSRVVARRRLVADSTRQCHGCHVRTDHVAGAQRVVTVVTIGDALDRQVHQCLIAADDLLTKRNINLTESLFRECFHQQL